MDQYRSIRNYARQYQRRLVFESRFNLIGPLYLVLSSYIKQLLIIMFLHSFLTMLFLLVTANYLYAIKSPFPRADAASQIGSYTSNSD